MSSNQVPNFMPPRQRSQIKQKNRVAKKILGIFHEFIINLDSKSRERKWEERERVRERER